MLLMIFEYNLVSDSSSDLVISYLFIFVICCFLKRKDFRVCINLEKIIIFHMTEKIEIYIYTSYYTEKYANSILLTI